jgi:transcriptional regulator with XRE-family HTH domain
MADIRDALRENLDTLCSEYTEEHGVSLSEVARRMGFLPQKLDKLLKGQLQIRFQEAETIRAFFNVSIAWLCGESEIRERLTPEMQSAVQTLLNTASQPKR